MRSSTIFLQIVIVLIGIGALALMLWEPHIEGRNAHATLFQIYFNDPFLAYAYIASISFFVALYQAFKVLGYARQNKVFSKASVKALRTIKYCAIAIVGFVAIGEIFILFANSANPTQSITEKAAYDVTNIGVDLAAVDRDIALAGMFMVLFLTANSIAAAVRERFVEFATLKTLGFSDYRVMWLVFIEAAIPCGLGAVAGVAIAAAVPGTVHLLFPSLGLPLPTITTMVFVWAMISAAIVALASSALPALRLKRLQIAAVLSGRK